MREPRVVAEADELEVDARVTQELKLFDVLNNGLGLHKSLPEFLRADWPSDANHPINPCINLHDDRFISDREF